MNVAASGLHELRVLILAPTSKDSDLTRKVLQDAGVECLACDDMQQLCDEVNAGAAAIVLPEEAIVAQRNDRLSEILARQPPWSDLPLLVLARTGADSASVSRAMDLFGNVTVLERPMRISALVSAVRSALRARRRQYQIREHLIERERAEEALRKADRRKDEFLAILAHELRNPLAPIRNSLYILQLTGRSDPMARRVGEMMERQVSHMVRLVDDLLEVSRITRGKIELRDDELELAKVISHAVETSRPLIEAGHHTLTVSLPTEPMALRGDDVRLAQVFSNLLNNAAKYTDAGGRIELRGHREADEIVVSIKDNGTGIPPEMLTRVFDLFTQVDGAANRASGGLGIGLTLVKSLVTLHGGTIEAHSAGPGTGSEFIVRLPSLPSGARGAKDARVDAQAHAAGAPPVAGRVLVVDDNRDAGDSLAMLLRLLGAEVRVAASGVEGLALLDDFRPKLLLVDIGMPAMDGYEVAQRIRARPDGASYTVVALTGWGQDDARERSSSAGFDHHLVKPSDVEQLRSLLARADAQA